MLIIGAVVIISLAVLADRTILKRRGTTVVVDGKAVSVRRKRDSELLGTIVLVMFILLAIGIALIEGDIAVLWFSVIPLGAWTLWSLMKAFRTVDAIPSENEIRAWNVVSRRSVLIVLIMVILIGLGVAAQAISGGVRVILCGTGIGLGSLMLWLVWRMWREARAKAAGHIG